MELLGLEVGLQQTWFEVLNDIIFVRVTKDVALIDLNGRRGFKQSTAIIWDRCFLVVVSIYCTYVCQHYQMLLDWCSYINGVCVCYPCTIPFMTLSQFSAYYSLHEGLPSKGTETLY